MIPKIYKSSEREFKNNGFGFLTDVIKSSAYEERNGEDKITIEYPIEGKNYDKLVRENIIMYKASATRGKQPYRITSVKKKQDSASVEVIARHVTFDDLDNFVVKAETDLSPSVFMPNLPEMMILKTGVTYSSDNQTRPTVKLAWERKNPLAMIAGEEGSLLQVFGGDLKRDFWNVSFNKKRGRQGKVTVRNKRDLVGLDLTEDDTQVVTRIYPYKIVQVDVPVIGGEEGRTEKQDFLITLKEKFIDSQHVGDYRQPKILPVDFGGDEKVTDEASLRERASKYFVENTGIDLPKVSGEIKVQELTKTTEYKNFSKLVSLDVCDKINVVSSKIGVRLSAVVNSIEYDGVAEDYIALNVGDKLLSFGEANKKQWNSVQNEITNINNSISDIEAGASFGNNATWGINPPANPKKGDLWFKQLEDSSAELYQWDGYGWELRIDPNIDEQIKEQIKDLETGMEEAKDIANKASEKALDNAKNFGNLLQNFTYENKFDRWTIQFPATVPYFKMLPQTFQGQEVPALYFGGAASPTSLNAYIYSDWIKIDPTKAYEFSVWIRTPRTEGAQGQDYISTLTLNQVETPKNDNFNSTNHYRITKAGVQTSTTVNNLVVDSWSNHIEFKQYRAIIMPSGFSPQDMIDRGYNVYANTVFLPANRWMRIRLVAFGQAGKPRSTLWLNPILSEISADATQYGSHVKQTVDGIQVTVEGKADKSQVTILENQVSSVVESVEKSVLNYNRQRTPFLPPYMEKSLPEEGTKAIRNLQPYPDFKAKVNLFGAELWAWSKTGKLIKFLKTTSTIASYVTTPKVDYADFTQGDIYEYTFKARYWGTTNVEPKPTDTKKEYVLRTKFTRNGKTELVTINNQEWTTVKLQQIMGADDVNINGIFFMTNPNLVGIPDDVFIELKEIGIYPQNRVPKVIEDNYNYDSLRTKGMNLVIDGDGIPKPNFMDINFNNKITEWTRTAKIVEFGYHKEYTKPLIKMFLPVANMELAYRRHNPAVPLTYTMTVRYRGINNTTDSKDIVNVVTALTDGLYFNRAELNTTAVGKDWKKISVTIMPTSSNKDYDTFYLGLESMTSTVPKQFIEVKDFGVYETNVNNIPNVVVNDFQPTKVIKGEEGVGETTVVKEIVRDSYFNVLFKKDSKQNFVKLRKLAKKDFDTDKKFIMTFKVRKTYDEEKPDATTKFFYEFNKEVKELTVNSKDWTTVTKEFIAPLVMDEEQYRIQFYPRNKPAVNTVLPENVQLDIKEVGVFLETVPDTIVENYPSDYPTRSSIVQLSDNINLKVDKDGIISQINLSPEGVLIQGKNVWIDGKTQIDDAVIKSANIESVSASQISAGTIDAKEINVINLSANAIRTGSIVGKNLQINLDSGVVSFQHGRIEKTDGNFIIDVDEGTLMTRKSGVRSTLLESGMITLWDTTLSGGLFNETRLGRITNHVTDLSMQSMFSMIGSTGALMTTEGDTIDMLLGGPKGAKVYVTGKTGKITVSPNATNWSPSSGAKPILAYIKGKSFDIRGVQPISYNNSKIEYKIFVDSDVGYQWILEQDITGGVPTYNGTALGAYISGEKQVKIEAGYNPSTPMSSAQTIRLDANGMFFNGNIREMFTSLTPSLNQSSTLKYFEDHIKSYFGNHIRMVTGFNGETTFAQNTWNGSWAVVKGNLQNQSHRFQKTNIVDMEDGAIEKLDKLRFREYNRVSQLKSGRLSSEWGLVTDEIPFNELIGNDREGIVLYPLVSLVGKGLQEEVTKRKALESELQEMKEQIKFLMNKL